MSTEYSRGNVEALDFLQCLNHPPSDAFAEVIFLHGEKIIQGACARLIQEALRGKKVKIQEDVLRLFSILKSLEPAGHRGPPYLMRHLPIVGVLLQMEKSFLQLEKGEVFSDPVWGGPLEDILQEVLSNPLQMSTWGMDIRQRKARAMGRVARTIRSLVSESLENPDVGNIESLVETFPVQRRVWLAGNYVTAPFAEIGLVLEGEGPKSLPETPSD